VSINAPQVTLSSEIDARLPVAAVAEAREQWQRTAKAIAAGVRENRQVSPVELRRRYNSIRRLTGEARRMMLLSAAESDVSVRYAIDPHLISYYCTYWDDRGARDFDFLDGEWTSDEARERTRYFVHLVGSILRLPNLLCLNAGKTEIGQMLAGFLNEPPLGAKPASDKEEHLESFEKALEEIRSTAEVSRLLQVNPDQISGFILDKFEALITAGSIPLMQQQLSAARLIQVLKSGTLKAPIPALIETVTANQRQHLFYSRRLLDKFNRDDKASRAARLSFYRAYAWFVEDTQLREGRLSSDLSKLRPGEILNIEALLELHLIGLALELSDVPVRLQYITSSSALFAFASVFSPSDLKVELVHPRNVFFFDQNGDGTEEFPAVLGAPNAFVDAVAEDGVVRLAEIERFERDYVDLLRKVRSTYSFATVDSSRERGDLVTVMADFARAQKGHRRSSLEQKLAGISTHLETSSAQVKEAFALTAPELNVRGFDAYMAFVDQLAGERRHMVMVRKFGAPSAGVERVVCLLIGGGFRHIVKLYDSHAADLLGADLTSVKAITLSQFVDLMRDAPSNGAGQGDGSVNESRVAVALPSFVRAVYALADREWLLAQTFFDVAIDKLSSGGTTEPLVPSSSKEGRRRLMLHEALLLRHYARRGIAAHHEVDRRRERWYDLAGGDLRNAAEILITVEDESGYTTKYEPNSVRIALGAFGLIAEGLCLQVSEEPALQAGRLLRELLPRTEEKKIAWYELVSVMEPPKGGDPSPLHPAFSDDIDELNARILTILQGLVKTPDQQRHSVEFWRFIAIRALEIRLLVDLVAKLQGLELTLRDPSVEVAAHLESLLADHESFVRELSTGSDVKGEAAAPIHPFSHLLIAAHRLLNMAEEGGDEKMIEARKLVRAELLLVIARLHDGLGSGGFPQSISRRILSRFGPEMADELRSLADRLESDWMLVQPE
jgi:hypothetical protein